MARQTRRMTAAASTSNSALATPVSALSLAEYTPTAASSPPTSVVPDSEANDEDELKLPSPPRAGRAAVVKGKKRAAPDSEDLDGEDGEEEKEEPAVKKRKTGSTAFVELPKRVTRAPARRRAAKEASDEEDEDLKLTAERKPSTRRKPAPSSDEEEVPLAAPSKAKGKARARGRARAPPASAPASDSEEEALASKAPARSKGKAKAKAADSDDELALPVSRPRPSRAASSRSKAPSTPTATRTTAKGKASPSDADLDLDAETLEYDSAAELALEASDSELEAAAQESDDSGSEFGVDDEEDEDMDVDEEVAGPSSRRRSRAAPSEEEMLTPAARAAAAAELRRLRASAGEREYDIDSSDEAALATTASKRGRGRGVGLKGKGKKKKFNDQETGLTPSKDELKGLGKEEKRMLRMKYANPLKYEETVARKELGRKLTWAEKASVALRVHHPELRDAWGDLEADVPVVEPVKAEQPADLKCTLLPFQQESLYWMRKQELGIYGGGLLADEMGMGKTIQMIALMVSEPGRPNLVIAPTVAVMQWRNEIETHTTGMKVVVWHGSGRENNIKELVKNDVVLTTYAVVESCFRKQEAGWKRKGVIVKEKSPVHCVEWNRVILDEAHNIKERATNTAKAAFALKAKYRWCLSGTPLQNRVGELYSLVRFLGVDPFSFYYCKRCPCKSLHWRFADKKGCDACGHSPMQHTCFWNNEILTPIQKHSFTGPGRLAFKKLHILLDRIMLRRTKLQKAEDLGLPPRTIVVRRDWFSPEEKELYLSLFSDAKREFSTYVDAGTLLNNYSNVFSLLTRMRQMACHPDLVLRSKTNAGHYIPGADDEAAVCRLCHDAAEDAIAARCKHVFDRECIRQYLSTADDDVQPDCPVCHVPLTIDLEADAIDFGEGNANGKNRQGILGRLDLDTWRSSTKIEALVEELDGLRRKDATTKSIVFSQFVNFLDLIAFRLQRAGFVVCRLEGTMSPQARDATIKHFMNNVHVTVFLVSLKAGGVALNLTEASRVYLMDSWWNPAVEFQAMDRIHRLGQRRPVRAIKLVVEDSIESRIVQLQEKKSAMVDATLSTDDQAMGRLTAEDLGFLFRL